MYRMRILLLRTFFIGFLSTLVSVPLFVSAETFVPFSPPTGANGQPRALTTEEMIAELEKIQNSPEVQAVKKTAEDAASLQSNLDQFVEARKQLILQPAEIQKKAILDNLNIKINPKAPGPNELVRITIESYLTDLYKANVSWSLNGKVLYRGVGRTIFVFPNGPSGKTTTVSLIITTNAGEVITKDFSFTPVGVTILWEADTYTPPFYRGKALMVPQARLRVIAVPDIVGPTNPLGSGNLVYTWKKNGTIYEDASGYGKNSFSFIGPPPLTSTNIRVAVSSLDDRIQSELSVNVPIFRPFILFYEQHPLLGVLYNKPFPSNYNLDQKEFSVSAEPYFFSNEKAGTQTLRYNWSINGKSVQNSGRTITLRNDAGIKGSSAVSLTMSGVNQTFQSASKDVLVKFQKGNGSDRPTF